MDNSIRITAMRTKKGNNEMADQFTLQHGGSDQFLEQWGIVPQPAIPFTTPEDNGKVLGVSEGQYALVSGGGGGSVEPLVVEAIHSIDEETEDETVTFDKTFSEIKTAYESGRPVFVFEQYTTLDGTEMIRYSSILALEIETGADYTLYMVKTQSDMAYYADNINGYPSTASV